MKRLSWWFRIVGLFYLLLTVVNIGGLFLSGGQFVEGILPMPMKSDSLAVQSFSDAWLVFVMELGVLGVFALRAVAAPLKNRILVWVIVFAEIFRGVVADAIWIVRGYNPVNYSVFIVIHLIIIATGILFLRQADSQS